MQLKMQVRLQGCPVRFLRRVLHPIEAYAGLVWLDKRKALLRADGHENGVTSHRSIAHFEARCALARSLADVIANYGGWS